jgi:hypothetical protein
MTTYDCGQPDCAWSFVPDHIHATPGSLRRCTHTGSSCIHRRFEPQADRNPVGVTWRDIAEIVGGTLVLLAFLVGLAVWGGILTAGAS